MEPNMKILIFCSVFVFICGPCSSNEIIDEFKKCKFGPGFDECYCGALNNILPKLQNGNDELGIPPLEPLSIPDIVHKPKSSGALQINQEWKNNMVYNFSKSTFTKVHFDMANNTISFELFNPEILLSGTNKINGKILQLPVRGGGAYSFVFKKLITKFMTRFEKVNRDGDIYLNFIKSWGKFYPEKIILQSENIIDGQKELSEQLVAMINENWKALYEEAEKPFTTFLGVVMTGILNKEFSKLPIHKVFGSF